MLIHISGLMIGLSKTNMQRTCHNFTTGFDTVLSCLLEEQNKHNWIPDELRNWGRPCISRHGTVWRDHIAITWGDVCLKAMDREKWRLGSNIRRKLPMQSRQRGWGGEFWLLRHSFPTIWLQLSWKQFIREECHNMQATGRTKVFVLSRHQIRGWLH